MSQLPRPKGGIPVRSGIPQPTSRLSQPTSRIPQSRIPQGASGIARPTIIGKSVQDTIAAHKVKQQNAQVIKRMGTYGNVVHFDELRDAPKEVTRQQVDENMKDLGTRMKQKKLVGVVKKFGTRPLPDTAFIPAVDVKSRLNHRKVLQQVSTPNKLHEQNLERQQTEAQKAMHNTFMEAMGISMEDKDISIVSQQVKMKEKVQELKRTQSGLLCGQYSKLIQTMAGFKGPENEELRRIAKIKFLDTIERDLPMFFTMLKMTVGKEHYEEYHEDEDAKRRFIKMIRDYFQNNPLPENCRAGLQHLMKQVPLPIRIEKPVSHVEREPMSPLAALKRPPSNSALAQPGFSRIQQPSRVPSSRTLRPTSAPTNAQHPPSPALRSSAPRQHSTGQPTPRSAETVRTPANAPMQRNVKSASPLRPHSTPNSRKNQTLMATPTPGQQRMHQPQFGSRSPIETIQKKVTHGLKQLQTMKNREKASSKTIKQKLALLTARFCKIYSANHNLTRSAGFEIWSKVFINNLSPILDDLEAYYRDLPHANTTKFNRDHVAYKFHNFLFVLYNDTKRFSVGKNDCEKMVSNRIAASAELARLKKLQEILADFIEEIHDLLGPYVPEEEESEEEESEEEPVRQPTQKQMVAKPTQKPMVAQPTQKPMVAQPTQMPMVQPRILQLQSQAGAKRPLAKVPSKIAQRRPVMRPRVALPEVSPIQKVVQVPRRSPEKVPSPSRQTPDIRVTPATKEHRKNPPRVAVQNDQMDRLSPPKTPQPNPRHTSPFYRSLDTAPKFLPDSPENSMPNEYRPTRLDILKYNSALDLVHKISNLEDRVRRSSTPTYRPISPGSPGRDNLPFDNRTYTIITDTSFQVPNREEVVAKLRKRWSDMKPLDNTIQPDQPTLPEKEENAEDSEDEDADTVIERTLVDNDNTLLKNYVAMLDEKWDSIEEHFCILLTNSKLHHTKVEHDINTLIGDLKYEIMEILYGWNDAFFADEMDVVETDFLRVNNVVRKCLRRMRTEKISFEDCQDIISGEMDVHGFPENDLRHQLHDAFDHMEYVKDKYRRKIVGGEAKGHLYKLEENVPERVVASDLHMNKNKPFAINDDEPRKQLSDILEDSDTEEDDDRYYYGQDGRPIEIKKRLDAPPEEGQAGPSRFSKPIVHFPDNIEDSPQRGNIVDNYNYDADSPQFTQLPIMIITDTEGRDKRYEEPRDVATKAVPEFFIGLGVPDLLIERDILHVACQLTEREVGDLPVAFDNLTKNVLEVARAYKQGVVDKDKALETIGNVFWKVPCLPIEFSNTFIYHPMNSFFGEMEVNDPETNAVIRANIMNDRAVRQCDETNLNSTGGFDISSYADKTWYNIFIEEDANDIAQDLENSTKSTDIDNDLDISLGDVTIEDCELSNSGNDFTAFPSSINASFKSTIVTDEEQMSLLNSGAIPSSQVIIDEMLADLDAVEARLNQQQNEGQNHLDNSAIYGKGIKHILHPTILQRHNYWQSRGGDIPSWFPGMYTVFQDSFELKPFVHNDTNNVFLHAWKTMAPYINTSAA